MLKLKKKNITINNFNEAFNSVQVIICTEKKRNFVVLFVVHLTGIRKPDRPSIDIMKPIHQKVPDYMATRRTCFIDTEIDAPLENKHNNQPVETVICISNLR